MKAYAAYFVPDMIHNQIIRCDLLVKFDIIRFLCSHVPLNTAFSEVSQLILLISMLLITK